MENPESPGEILSEKKLCKICGKERTRGHHHGKAKTSTLPAIAAQTDAEETSPSERLISVLDKRVLELRNLYLAIKVLNENGAGIELPDHLKSLTLGM